MSLTTQPTAVFVGPTDVVLEAMFGPFQHDLHVKRWREREWHRKADAFCDAADARVKAEVDRIIADIRAKRAARQSFQIAAE